MAYNNWGKKNPERRREIDRQFRERNRDRLRIQRREQATEERKKNPEAHAARIRAWRTANPERARENDRRGAHRRRARIRGNTVDIGLVDEYINVLAGDPCAYCGARSETEDHIVPISKGGSHTWENLTASCNKCNGHKHAKTLLVWLLNGSA